MIAIPLEKKTSTTISDLYGNAPFFALLDPLSGYFSVEENSGCGNGLETASYIKKSGATGTIFYHMGEGVYKSLEKDGIEVYSSMKNYLTIEEIYKLVLNDTFKVLDENNYKTLLDPGIESGSCECSH